MEDIGLVKQGWNWLQSQKHLCSWVCDAMRCFGEKAEAMAERHWPLVCSGCGKLLGLLSLSFIYWKDCILRGFQSSAKFGSAALLLIMWTCFLSLTSIACLVYVLLGMVRLLDSLFLSSRFWVSRCLNNKDFFVCEQERLSKSQICSWLYEKKLL